MFAIALARRFGWTIHLVLDNDERYWEDPADSDNFIPTVIHAYAIDERGNAWDVLGVRHYSAIRPEIDEWIEIRDYASDDELSEQDLAMYVGCWSSEGEPIDRPLSEYSDADVQEALHVAQRIVDELAQQLPEHARPSLMLNEEAASLRVGL